MIEAVGLGGMSRLGPAQRFGVSKSAAIKWVERFERTGVRAAAKMGGYKRPKLGSIGSSLNSFAHKAQHHAASALRSPAGGTRRHGRHVADGPLPAPPRPDAQKKNLRAREQDRRDVKRHRARWRK